MQKDTILYGERELFLQVSDGNESAFRQLFLLYGKLLYPFLYRISKSEWTAEELIQETMLRVWLNRDQLPEIENHRAWTFRIATNLAYTQLKKTLRQASYTAVQQKQPEQSTDETEESYHLKRLKECVKEAVERLPEQRRRIYQLSRDKELTRAEIALQLNISEKTVKNSLNSALSSIRQHLQREGYLVSMLLLLAIEK